MNKMLLMGIILLLLSGCEYSSAPLVVNSAPDVHTVCSDAVICYFYSRGYSGGMDCFRDSDLIEKYCGG